jgi:hypothetical protein
MEPVACLGLIFLFRLEEKLSHLLSVRRIHKVYVEIEKAKGEQLSSERTGT